MAEHAIGRDRAGQSRPAGTPEPAEPSRPNVSRPAAAPPAPATPQRPARPASGTPRPARRGARIAVLALALVAIALAGTVVGLAPGVAKHSSAGRQSTAALQRQALVARAQAASWVVQQVDHTAAVSCDPAMCAALAKDGFPAGKLVILGPASPTAPVTSQIVVVTPTVRDWFGSSLAAAYAPAVLASFASGSAQVSVRVMAPHGAGAYDAAYDSDLGQRKAFGNALLSNLNTSRITITAAARQQLAAGQVDSRLVLAITSLAGDVPIDIVEFANPGQGVSSDVPLRFADLAGNDPAANLTSSAYLKAMQAAANAPNMVYAPDRIQTAVFPGHTTVIQVEFHAPSPFGLLTGQ